MERTRAHPAAPRFACVACSSAVSDDRCGYCGATQQAGGYRVLQVLSRSAHGAVYLAEDHAGARVALKEVVFSLVPSTRELDAFEREAGLLRTLSHPALPRFVDAFKQGEGVATRLYLAQEYVPGLNLAGHLTITRYDEPQVLAFGRQALEVLAYLHSRSPPIVHRDVKPANLVVTTAGFLKLVDLGAAREVSPQGTHRSTLVGTFGYMAPEQLGGTVDARSDLYGLGATLVHLLTRKPPEQLLTPGHELDFERHANVGPRTRVFLKRLTAVRPGDRFDSALQALAFLDGEDVRPPLTARRFRQVGLVLGGVAALLAGAGVVFSARGDERASSAAVVVEPAKPPVAPPSSKVTLSRSGPPDRDLSFKWRRASWEFRRSQGPFLHDASGRGHDLEIPRVGYTQDFFGLKWDGTAAMAIEDHPDFAVTNGPLMLTFDATTWEGKAATLMERSSPDGALAWRLELAHGRQARFTISDGQGRFTSIEGHLPERKKGGLTGFHLYATYDVRTGELVLRDSCHLVASGTSGLVIPKSLGPGGRVTLLDGYKGVVEAVTIENGTMKPSGGEDPERCTLSGADLDVSDD